MGNVGIGLPSLGLMFIDVHGGSAHFAGVSARCC